MIKKGLQDTPEDPHDFPLGSLVRLPKLEELPEEFVLETISVKDQKDTDFCTAFASCLLSEMQEGVVLSPEYQFALSKNLSGGIDEWGQNIRAMLKSHTKAGALEQKDAPYSLENKDPDFLRRLANWPAELIQKIGFHKKKSFAKITGPYDHFDNIRATIWKFRNEKRGALSGLLWQWGLDEYELTGTNNEGQGHALPYIGWSRNGIISQNSAGKEAGILGRHNISKETINHFVERYGAYMMIDLSPDELRYYLENGIKLEDNWITAIRKSLFSFMLCR